MTFLTTLQFPDCSRFSCEWPQCPLQTSRDNTSKNILHLTPFLQRLLPNPHALIAVSKGMWAVKICTNKIFQPQIQPYANIKLNWTVLSTKRTVMTYNRTLTHPDASVTVSLRHADVCVSLDVGRLCTAQWLQVFHAVVHVLDGKTQYLDAHSADVRCSHFAHELCKLIPVLVNCLHTQRT